MFEILYSTGMPRKELTALRLYDLDLERGTVMIREGKGKKDRLLPLGARAAAWLKYLEDARPRLVVEPDERDIGIVSEQICRREVKAHHVSVAAPVAIGGNSRKGVGPIRKAEPRTDECVVAIQGGGQRIDGDAGRCPGGGAGHGQGAAPGCIRQLIQRVHAQRLNQGIVRPGTQVSRGIVEITELFMEPIAPAAFLTRRTFQLPDRIVAIAHLAAIDPDRVGASIALIVKIGVRVQHRAATVPQPLTSTRRLPGDTIYPMAGTDTFLACQVQYCQPVS